MNKILSIIIPMYNVENYLKECINQINIKDIDYEILMINDGSSDNSLMIADSLANNNPKIRVISQENKGLGGARNTGIEYAIGKYILFLDADDFLIKTDFSFLKNSKYDIIEFSAQLVSMNQQIIKKIQVTDVSGLSGVNYLTQFNIQPSACNKIYRKDFLLEHNLFFKEKIYSEDIHLNSRAYFLAKTVASQVEVIQQFRQSPNSITRNGSTEKKQKMFDDLNFIFEDILSFKNKYAKHNFEIEYFNYILSDLGLGIINFGLLNNKDVSKVFYFLKNHNILSKKYNLDFKKNLFRKAILLPFGLKFLKLAYGKRK